jgi:REP element-mobilizing transposase RayT
MNRGDRREEIFKDNQDREGFRETLGQVCVKTGWQIHGLCLMGNHFHLVVETPQGNLVAGMKWFLDTYTSRFNRRHKLFGRLFSGRYKALMVDGSGNGYLKTVCDSVHLSPTRQGRSLAVVFGTGRKPCAMPAGEAISRCGSSRGATVMQAPDFTPPGTGQQADPHGTLRVQS